MKSNKPVKLYNDTAKAECIVCGKDIFSDPNNSIVVLVEDRTTNKYSKVYPCCKGKCDYAAKNGLQRNEIDGWKDATTFTNPILYLKHVMAVMNNMHEGVKFNDEAFESYKKILIAGAQYVLREPEHNELESANFDNMMPF